MSGTFEDVAKLIGDAKGVLDQVTPWWDVVEPLVKALEDGHLSKDEVVLMAKAAMLRATEERLKAELP